MAALDPGWAPAPIRPLQPPHYRIRGYHWLRNGPTNLLTGALVPAAARWILSGTGQARTDGNAQPCRSGFGASEAGHDLAESETAPVADQKHRSLLRRVLQIQTVQRVTRLWIRHGVGSLRCPRSRVQPVRHPGLTDTARLSHCTRLISRHASAMT